MHIYDYFCQQARLITDAAPRKLGTPEEWRSQRPHHLKQYYEMMGLSDLPPREDWTPLKATVTGAFERDGYRVENFHYQSLPGLYVAGNLYVPAGAARKEMPAVLYFSGHTKHPRSYYQAHLRRFAQLGFVALAIDTINLGELPGYHHGVFSEGWWHWYSRGYTPAGVELFNAIRAVDFLQSLAYVDDERIGVTGLSGGGATSWWLAAADDRIRCVAPVCATGTVASHLIDRTIDGHCDCMFPINTYGWDMIDIAALVAPRPCLVAAADRDRVFTIASTREFCERLKRVYQLLQAGSNLALVETPGMHGYQERSRTSVFSWFLKHLADQEIEPSDIDDIDSQDDEPDEQLRVFTNGLPRDEITTSIQDRFVTTATPPDIKDAADLYRHREAVVAALRKKTFRHFPSKPCPTDLKIEFEWELENTSGKCFSFSPEGDSRLWGNLHTPQESSNPGLTMVSLQNTGDRYFGRSLFSDQSPDWREVTIETHGSGRSSWGPEFQWHLRRAAMLTGRTIASMRVWDTLRALEAVRKLPEVAASRIALAGSGEMAAVALYAALLDGNVSAIVLHNPPATQDAPGNRRSSGADAIEMLNCLRITDLPQVAGLLFPAELVFLGPRPSSYVWAEDLYFRLGGRVCHVMELTGCQIDFNQPATAGKA